jgi:hypothetical protein
VPSAELLLPMEGAGIPGAPISDAPRPVEAVPLPLDAASPDTEPKPAMALLPELLGEKPLLLGLVPAPLASPALPDAQDPLVLVPGLDEAELDPLPAQDAGVAELAVVVVGEPPPLEPLPGRLPAVADPLASVPGALEPGLHGEAAVPSSSPPDGVTAIPEGTVPAKLLPAQVFPVVVLPG